MGVEKVPKKYTDDGQGDIIKKDTLKTGTQLLILDTFLQNPYAYRDLEENEVSDEDKDLWAKVQVINSDSENDIRKVKITPTSFRNLSEEFGEVPTQWAEKKVTLTNIDDKKYPTVMLSPIQ